MKPTIGIVNPPLGGHSLRGMGIYGSNLASTLRNTEGIHTQSLAFGKKPMNLDLLHYPYFDMFFLTLKHYPPVPTVVTVHDLIPLRFPDHFRPGIRGLIKWKIQERRLRQSAAIITDSHASKADIIRYTGIAEGKIHVIYLGVSENFRPMQNKKAMHTARQRLGLPDQYILYVGDVNYNKNIPALIRAFSLVRKKIPGVKLILIGNGFISPTPELAEILSLIHSEGTEEHILRKNKISEEDLVSLYNLADIYVQPSLAEGFGLTILEAMACGTPVIAADAGSLPEITGDAGILIDPEKPAELAAQMISLLQDTSLRRKLSAAGLSQARKFTWKKCAEETLDVYAKILT